MRNIFNMDNGFFRAMGRLADLMILNLLFILFSLPIVTIGASATAMHYVTLKMAANEEGYVFRSFWKSFRQNFLQATVIWVAMLVVGFVLGLDLSILNRADGSFNKILLVLISAITLLYIMVLIYVFPLLSRFENKITITIRNAFIIAIADFPRTFLMMVLVIGAVILTIWNNFTFWYGLLFWLLCGFALIAFANSFFFNKIFRKYTPEEATDADDGELFPETEGETTDEKTEK